MDKKLQILYTDPHLIAVVKPPGIASQSAGGFEQDMVSLLKNELIKGKKQERSLHNSEPYLAVVHRLDKPVGGVMVYARTKKAASALSKQIQEHAWEKIYMAVLVGEPGDGQKSGHLTDWIVEGKGSQPSVVLGNSGVPASGIRQGILDYEILETAGGLSLARIHLLTGRRHQIRVQMAAAGLPVAGDRKYGTGKAGDGKNGTGKAGDGKNEKYGTEAVAKDLEKLAFPGLFAVSLSFTHPVTAKKMVFQTEPQGPAFDLFNRLRRSASTEA